MPLSVGVGCMHMVFTTKGIVSLAGLWGQGISNGNAKKQPMAAFLILAEWTGLEPATPGVTGRYSNQLNYHSNLGGR